MAEELIHHLQAYQQFPEITCLESMSCVSLEPFRNSLTNFRQEITSIIYDINAHLAMKQREISLNQILQSDLKNARNAIADANSSPQKLRELKEGKGKISGFPQYLLWWFDLFELGHYPYVDYWRKEINPWFCEHVNESVMRTWEELTGFIHQYPVIDPLSAQRALTEICMTLLNCVPTFSPKRTSGRSLQVLLMKDLVPK